MQQIREIYGVPAKRGGRVEYTGEREPVMGTICRARGMHLRIRLDGMKRPATFHPTWELRYLDAAQAQAKGE